MKMKPSDVADLLVLDSVLNRFASAINTSAEKAVAWAAVLNQSAPGMTPDEGRELIVEHYGESSESLTPYALVDAWKKRKRLMPKQIADDVRAAKARGLIGKGHDPRVPLPAGVMRRLMSARAEAQALAPELDYSPSQLQIEVGKRVR